MQRRAWLIAVIGIAFVALIGLIITFGVPDREKRPPEGEEAVEAVPAEGAPARRAALEFRRLEVDTSTVEAKACLVFTAALDESGATRYSDYLTIAPDTPVDVRAQGNRLCLAGLDFAARYEVTLRAGLPAASGARLAASETVPVELRDRPPIVAFEDGFILPRLSGAGVPLTTVNVDAVEIEVIRVSDRLLSQLRAGLVDERTIYGYDRNTLKEEQGELVWQGTMQVKGARNEEVTTLFSLREAIKGRKPGVYLLTARDLALREGVADPYEEEWAGRAAQWVIDTDLGLTTYRGADGMTAFVRSLASADPVDGVELALVARNNVELARVKTDREGKAEFAAGLLRGQGGSEPVALLAYGKDGDFAYLDLRRAAFDLSDRGVSGRASPGAIDAYLYTERGIYRPGETVHLVALLRDREAQALAEAPLIVRLRRPDGMIYRELKAPALQQGAAALALNLSDTAPRGRWSAAAYVDPEGEPVGRVEFDVQDFVPERLKLTLTPEKARVAPGEEAKVAIEARFLYGAPGAGLGGELEMRLVPAAAPFPQYTDYLFGLADDPFSAATLSFPIPATDADGRTTAGALIPPETQASFPLEARLSAGLFEPGGRMTRAEVKVLVFTRPLYLGLRPLFDNNEVGEGAQARFALVALSDTGRALDRAGLRLELVREETDYQWYEIDGEWRFETVTRDRLVETRLIDARAGAPVELAVRVGWGAYRLTVSDAASGAKTSVRFYAGWGASASADRPDRVAVHADQESYSVGETARLSIRAPEGGKALIVLAGDRVFASRLIEVPKGGTETTVSVDKAWGSGAYAIVTLYRPLKAGQEARTPVRAIGLVWLGVDARARTLAIDIEAPQVVRPRTTIEVPVTVTNARPGERLKLALAAVDEGILQLTDYSSPAPAAYYFGKRRLGVDLRDDYGRLIRGAEGAVGALREGGDSLGGRALAVVPTRTVALFSGLVDVGERGRATVRLALPDFVGELRLMAVAFGAQRMGEAERALTVRDPLVGELTLPRFLAPGDEAEATLLIDNVEGNFGTFRAALRFSGSLAPAEQAFEASLDRGERRTFAVPVKAGAAGIGTARLILDGPNNLHLERSWSIEVRPPVLPVYDERTASLEPGAEANIDVSLLKGYAPESASLTLAVAATRGLDVPALLKWLDRYPYGCLEQTTSRALPLLYAGALAKAAGIATDQGLRARVQEAIERVIDMQHYSGAFGMWGAMSEPADPWLAVFAIDFLAEARAQGYVVPEAALGRAFDWLRGFAAQTHQPAPARAYALYVLARAGTAKAGDVRYFYDTAEAQFADAIAPALAAAALAQLGDRARAHAGFARALQIARESAPATYPAQRYGSLLRDVAGLTALAASAGETQLLPALMTRTAELEPPIAFTTTQEKAWLVRAAAAIEAAQRAIEVTVTGAKASGSKGMLQVAPTRAELEAGVTLKNAGEAPVWWSATVSGVPEAPLPAEARGITIEKHYFTLEGAPVDLARLRQSERVVVAIRGVMQENVHRTMAVLDLLPAGLEIEAVVQNLANGQPLYPWLGPVTETAAAEARDDRFVAAFDLGDRYVDPEGRRASFRPPFSVAYVARAVTPGQFALPAATVEAMYTPSIRARTAPGRLTVAPAR